MLKCLLNQQSNQNSNSTISTNDSNSNTNVETQLLIGGEEYTTQSISIPHMDNKCYDFTIPKGYIAKYLCKTLQGSIFVIENANKTDTTKPQKLALKQAFKNLVFENRSLNNIKIQENIHKEYSMLKRLSSVNAITKVTHDLYEDKHSFYFSIEYLDHGDLISFFNNLKKQIYDVRQKALKYQKAHNVTKMNMYMKQFTKLQEELHELIPMMFREICKNVFELHSKSCAHLDISLENIVLGNFNNGLNLKFIDFGVSQIFDPNDEYMKKNYISKDNYAFYDGFIGKEHYMAPEVWRCHMNGKNGNDKSKYIYDPFKADIWSIGVILYLLYTNTYPFPKEDIRKTGGQYNVAKLKLHHSCLPPKVADLLSKIFLPEKKRLNTVQLLSHPYVGLIDESKLQTKSATPSTPITTNNNSNDTNTTTTTTTTTSITSAITVATTATTTAVTTEKQHQELSQAIDDEKLQENAKPTTTTTTTELNKDDNNNVNEAEESYLPKAKPGQPKIIRHACKLVKLLYQS